MKVFSLLLFLLIVSQSVALAQTLNASHHWTQSQYIETISALSKTAETSKHTQKRASDALSDYLLKKWRYYRFLDNYTKTRKKELNTAGVAISVISSDDLLFLKGYGYADKQTKTAFTPISLFGVGSVSKIITGIAIMQLAEQGKVDLDAPLDHYIPDFSYQSHFPVAEPITIRTLMTHQSGLVGDFYKGWGSTDGPAQHFREVVDILQEEYLAYPPRYISAYSNLAVSLLGIVIEEVTGVEFKTYIKRNICRPLGMITSNFSFREYMDPLLAKTYDIEGNEAPFLFIRNEPAGSFISNALEMSLFMKMILNGGELFGNRILKQSTLEQMFIQQNSDIELDFPNEHGAKWGLSWILTNPNISYAGKYVGHNGSLRHYYTQMHFLPEQGLAVLVQTNSQTGRELSSDVANMAMKKALEIFKGITPPSELPISPTVQLTQNHDLQMTGTYASNSIGMVSIYPDNDKLIANSPVLGGDVQLVPHEDNWYSLVQNGQPAPGFENIRLTVRQGEQERFVGMEVRDPLDDSIYQSAAGFEYVPPDKLPVEWAKRVGRYSIINPDAFMLIGLGFELSIHDQGYIYMAGTFNVIDPILDDKAIRSGRGKGMNETIQIVDYQGEEHMYWLGYLYKREPATEMSGNLQSRRETSLGLEKQENTSLADPHKTGKEIEKRIIRQFRFPGLVE